MGDNLHIVRTGLRRDLKIPKVRRLRAVNNHLSLYLRFGNRRTHLRRCLHTWLDTRDCFPLRRDPLFIAHAGVSIPRGLLWCCCLAYRYRGVHNNLPFQCTYSLLLIFYRIVRLLVLRLIFDLFFSFILKLSEGIHYQPMRNILL